MKRRNFTELMLALSAGTVLAPLGGFGRGRVEDGQAAGDWSAGLPVGLTANIKTMIQKVVQSDYKQVNTDWFGSIQVEGLLRFAMRGYKEGHAFADSWFAYHVEHDKKLTDEEYYKQYEGAKARILRDGPLAFAIYSANLGVAFPVYELYRIDHSPVQRRVCLDVADAILHYAARDRFGMLAHDDNNFTLFAIPDTAYWATRANAIAAKLSPVPQVADVYWKQSIYQLEQGIDHFLDKEKGLVRTGLFKGEPGKTYWCRSQGWLLWAMGGLLRYLPRDHPKFGPVARDMHLLAEGLRKYQSPGGALRVLVDDPDSPEEVTGTAMMVSALKEACRKGWIPDVYQDMLARAWKYVEQSVDAQGNITHAYTGWAVTAENREVNRMDEKFMGYVPGVIMLAADEMSR